LLHFSLFDEASAHDAPLEKAAQAAVTTADLANLEIAPLDSAKTEDTLLHFSLFDEASAHDAPLDSGPKA
jgi:hypothetical protein